MASPSQALVRNWRLKLSALGLSVFLWALVQTEPTARAALLPPRHVAGDRMDVSIALKER